MLSDASTDTEGKVHMWCGTSTETKRNGSCSCVMVQAQKLMEFMWFSTSRKTNGKSTYSCGLVQAKKLMEKVHIQLQAQKETPSVSFACVGSANLR